MRTKMLYVWRISIISVIACTPTFSADVTVRESKLIERTIQFSENGDIPAYCNAVSALSESGLTLAFFASVKIEDPFYLLYLINKFPINPNHTNEIGENVTFYLVGESDRAPRIQLLSDIGVDILKPRGNGETLVHAAIRNSDINLLSELCGIFGSAALEAPDANEESPMFLAARLANAEAITKLISLGCKKNIRNKSNQAPHEVVGTMLSADGLSGPRVSNEIQENIRSILRE